MNSFDNQVLIQHAARVATMWPHPTREACQHFPEFCERYRIIKSCNLPNALGARITLPSGLNLQAWKKTPTELSQYRALLISALWLATWLQ